MAVGAEAERRGTAILAEGIETEEHLLRARAMGATLGQGWLFGRPGELPAPMPPPRPAAIPFRDKPGGIEKTPFDRVAGERQLRRGDKRLLLALSRQLETEAEALGEETVVSRPSRTCASSPRRAAAATCASVARPRWSARSAWACPRTRAEGVRGADLDRTDPLRGEWDVIVISPSFAGAFVARDLGDTGPDDERRFDFFVTYDRALVRSAAIPLMARILPDG